MTQADLERFRRLAGMLGSEHVGERAAAALKCTELLKAAGLTWSSVSLPVEQPDVLAQRRQSAGVDLRQKSEPAMSDLEEMIRARNRAGKEAAAARKAKWAPPRYGADADGSEPGRK